MELGKQIKKYRNNISLSQEQLAERIFVSRQTISNWENDKNYPDIKSLLLLSEVFEVSLDDLVKGDLEEMKNQINDKDISKFRKLSNILAVCFALIILTFVPLIKLLEVIGVIIWVAEYAITLFFSFKAEHFKKQHNIQTYREITAFMNGENIDNIKKIQETAKRPYQKIFCAVGAGFVTLIVLVIMFYIMY
ncbi:MAG: helix-turn-helix domain-containing protein [Ruminococcus sp.]|nr:helix-turn-helix domain-containing protein [Ruminococcus sp.]